MFQLRSALGKTRLRRDKENNVTRSLDFSFVDFLENIGANRQVPFSDRKVLRLMNPCKVSGTVESEQFANHVYKHFSYQKTKIGRHICATSQYPPALKDKVSHLTKPRSLFRSGTRDKQKTKN